MFVILGVWRIQRWSSPAGYHKERLFFVVANILSQQWLYVKEFSGKVKNKETCVIVNV